MPELRIFKLYWLNGKTEEIKGFDISDALTRAGHYCLDEASGLDYFEEI